MTTKYEAGWAVGDRCEVHGYHGEWIAATTVVALDDSSGWVVRIDDTQNARSAVRYLSEMRPIEPVDREAISVPARHSMSTPTPPSNATCRCGAPSLALFSSTECSRGAECPIVAGEPEPARVYEATMLMRHGIPERVWRADGRGHTVHHPLREGAIAAWRAKVTAPSVAAALARPMTPEMLCGATTYREWEASRDPGRAVDGVALHDSAPDPSRPGHEMVMVQFGAPVVSPASRQTITWRAKRESFEAGDLVVRDADGNLRAVRS